MKTNPIGIFDSGVGGLSVLKELVSLLPDENYIYFGDTARVPYGEKTKEQLESYVRGIMEWFTEKNVKAVVMACNSSSALVYENIKKEYKIPVYNLIEPTAEFISYINAQKIGVMATSATVNSEAYKKNIQKVSGGKEVFEIACPGLVEIVESNKAGTNEAKKMVIKYVTPLLEKGAEKIVLGCTHYPFLKDIITDIANDSEILIDPAKHLATKVSESLLIQELLNEDSNGTTKFYASSNTLMFIEAGKRFYPDLKKAEEFFIGEVSNVK